MPSTREHSPVDTQRATAASSSSSSGPVVKKARSAYGKLANQSFVPPKPPPPPAQRATSAPSQADFDRVPFMPKQSEITRSRYHGGNFPYVPPKPPPPPLNPTPVPKLPATSPPPAPKPKAASKRVKFEGEIILEYFQDQSPSRLASGTIVRSSSGKDGEIKN